MRQAAWAPCTYWKQLVVELWLLLASLIVVVRLRNLVAGHGKAELRHFSPEHQVSKFDRTSRIASAIEATESVSMPGQQCEHELGHVQAAADFLLLLQAPAFCRSSPI